MTRARRDENEQDEVVEVEEDSEADQRAGAAIEAAAAAAGIAPRVPVDPESAVQLRWVYSPGETRLQLKQGSDPWVTVPHVTLEEAEAETAAEAEKDDKSAR